MFRESTVHGNWLTWKQNMTWFIQRAYEFMMKMLFDIKQSCLFATLQILMSAQPSQAYVVVESVAMCLVISNVIVPLVKNSLQMAGHVKVSMSSVGKVLWRKGMQSSLSHQHYEPSYQWLLPILKTSNDAYFTFVLLLYQITKCDASQKNVPYVGQV